MFSNPEKILIQMGIAEGLRVADFGAGAGYYVELLAKKVGESGCVYAIDINQDLLAKIANEAEKTGLDNVETITGDVEKEGGTTLKAGSVDVVVIANTLYSMDDKIGAAKEAARILKKKGRVLVVDWADSFAGIGPHRDHVVTNVMAIKVFAEAGFNLDGDVEAGDHHYGLIFRKG